MPTHRISAFSDNDESEKITGQRGSSMKNKKEKTGDPPSSVDGVSEFLSVRAIIRMDLQKLKLVSRLVPCRHYAKGKPRMRILDYIPWRSEEVLKNINETLSTPYKQHVPTSKVRRCSESNPTNHTLADVGKFYTIPEEFKKRFFALGGFPKKFNDLNIIFNESSIMIRKPALEVIEYLKRADYNKLPVKYLLYGPISCGKRLTMIHILHYAGLNNFVTLNMPAAHYLHKFGRKEANISDTREGLVDLPLEGALLLKHFQLQNESLLRDLKTTKDYVWNARETTPVGTPLTEFIAYGVNRVKYSCDVLDGLVNELKKAATAGRIKLLVAVGGFNSFYAGKTMIRINEKYGTTTYQISIFDSFLKLLQPDWCNGAFLTYVCELTTVPEYRGSHMPFFLLRREGFEKLDPFVPVYVPELSEMEFHSLLDYYEDRRWLQKFGGREEIEFLTSRKAGDVRDFCAPL